MKFVKNDCLIWIDSEKVMRMFNFQEKISEKIELSFTCTQLYIANEKIFILSSDKGDIFFFDVNRFSFLPHTVNIQILKAYLNKNKKKIIYEKDSVVDVKFNILGMKYLIIAYKSSGVAIYNIEVKSILIRRSKK